MIFCYYKMKSTTQKTIPESQRLYLRGAGVKLQEISEITGKSQSEIVRKLIINEIGKIPDTLKPRFSEPITGWKKRRPAQIYMDGDLSAKFDSFSQKTGIPKSQIVRMLLLEEFAKWPAYFTTPD